MNWTGGSLQRHSKANANALVKKQKQHFARARLQSRSHRFRPPSSALSAPQDLPQTSPPKKGHFSQPTSQSQDQPEVFDRQDGRPSDIRWPFGKNISPSPRRRQRSQATDDEVTRQDDQGFLCQPFAETVHRQPETTGGIDYARKDLLERSDWVGLATARPARFNQSVRDEMERLGRRRRVTSLERKRTGIQGGPGKEAVRTIQMARQVPSLRSEDISVRVGSNIHRTQTIPSIAARKESTQPPAKTASEPVRPIEVQKETRTHHSDPKTPQDKVQSAQAHASEANMVSTNDLDHTYEDNLIPLDKAVGLNLTSWDKVREHSSRSGTQTAPSAASMPSSLLLPQPFDAEVGIFPSFHVFQQQRAVAASSPSCEQSWVRASTLTIPDIIQRGVAVGLLHHVTVERSSPTPFQERGGYSNDPSSHIQTRPSNDGAIQLPKSTVRDLAPHAGIEGRPGFTLEEQVELERTVEELEHREKRPTFIQATPNNRRSQLADMVQSSRDFATYAAGFGVNVGFDKHASILPLDEGEPARLRRHIRSTGGRSSGAGPTSMRQTPADQLAANMPSEIDCPVPPHSQYTRYPSNASLFTHSGDDRRAQKDITDNNTASASLPSVNMDNEAWMNYVFPDEFRQIQDGFQFHFSHAHPKQDAAGHHAKWSINNPSSASGGSASFRVEPGRPGTVSGLFESPNSIPTGANTSLFTPSPQDAEASETDFLSHFSPMQGCLDERMVDVSVYNNAPKTERAVWTASSIGTEWSGKSATHSISSVARPLIPAKRSAPDPLETRATISRPRHMHESATFPPQSSMWSVDNTTRTVQGSMKSNVSKKLPAARPLGRSTVLSVTNKFGRIQTPICDHSKGGRQGLEMVMDREESTASIFIPSDGLTADASLSHPSIIARPSANHNPRTAMFRLWSEISYGGSPELSDPSPGPAPGPAFFSPLAAPSGLNRKNAIVNIHALPPRNFAQPRTQFSTQIPLWSEG